MKKKIVLVLSALMLAGTLLGGCGMDEKITVNQNLVSTVSSSIYLTEEEVKEVMAMYGATDFEKYVSQNNMKKVEKNGKTYYEQKGEDQTLTKEQFEQQMGRMDENCIVVYGSNFIPSGNSSQNSGTGISDSEMEELIKQIEFMNIQVELPFTVAKSNAPADGNKLSIDGLQSAAMEDSDLIYAVADENLLKGTDLKITGASEGKYYNRKQTVRIDTADGVIRSMNVKINGKVSPFSDGTNAYNVTVCSEDGKYTISAELFSGTKQTLKFTVDKTKPAANVANNKTYKSGKKITFSDKTSGIKSAKLDGKTVKSGKVLKKKGSHKLVLTDKAGNKSAIKFKIK